VAAALVLTSAPAQARISDPIITGAANPGVARAPLGDGRAWVMMTTGSPTAGGNIRTAPAATGPWKKRGKGLLTHAPGWMRKKPVWAPSLVRATDGRWHVYYAGLVKGTTRNRCIGTGVADTAVGPFKPAGRPIACYSGSGTDPKDQIRREGPNKFSLIDPTPAIVDGDYVLTYKTSYVRSSGPRWHTTTRLLRLDPAYPSRPIANPRKADGGSIRITNSVHKYIEENPVLVERGGRYTLFTSFGWYGRCVYWTRYRQNGSLWNGWLKKSPTRLALPSGASTCGSGNAQVTRGAGQKGWRIWFNGHPDPKTTKGGPDGLYVGVVRWPGGKPRISSLLH